jgi:hypothetical protein
MRVWRIAVRTAIKEPLEPQLAKLARSDHGYKANISFTVQQPLMRVTIVAASIGLADVGDYCLGIFVLGSKGRDQSVLGINC